MQISNAIKITSSLKINKSILPQRAHLFRSRPHSFHPARQKKLAMLRFILGSTGAVNFIIQLIMNNILSSFLLCPTLGYFVDNSQPRETFRVSKCLNLSIIFFCSLTVSQVPDLRLSLHSEKQPDNSFRLPLRCLSPSWQKKFYNGFLLKGCQKIQEGLQASFDIFDAFACRINLLSWRAIS